MPIENERKFVLDDDGTLEPPLARRPGVARSFLRQAYLDVTGVRIRSIEGAAEAPQYVFTFKRAIDGQVVEIETAIDVKDFERLWTQRQATLEKVRYSWGDGPFHWDVDFFKSDGGRTYFTMAEVEMPEEQLEPPPLPEPLASRLLAIVPAGDQRFTSKRLADRSHAEALLAEIRRTGRIP